MDETPGESWLDAKLRDPEFRRDFVLALAELHAEAIERADVPLARWCMRERARFGESSRE